MAISVARYLNQVERIYPPVGPAVSLTVGMGIGDVLTGLARSFGMNPLISGALVGFGIARFGKRFFGSDTANLWGAGILANTINNEWNLQSRVANTLAGFTGGRVVATSHPLLVSGSAGTTPVVTPGPYSGNYYARMRGG